jgi:hypothetical protein
MKVRCIKVMSDVDNDLVLDTNGKLTRVNYSNDIVVGHTYNVYAILDSVCNKKYLIYSGQLIHFIHSECFELIESKIPNNWIEKDLRINNRMYHLIGYELLIIDDNHYNNLLQNDSGALMRFIKENNLFK